MGLLLPFKVSTNGVILTSLLFTEDLLYHSVITSKNSKSLKAPPTFP